MEIRCLFIDKINMKRLDYVRIIGSTLMILIGFALYYYILNNPFKGYSIIFITSGLIGLIKNIILKFILIALLLCITIIVILMV
jgi:hypothetical protein